LRVVGGDWEGRVIGYACEGHADVLL
jgi:hypothetical protein